LLSGLRDGTLSRAELDNKVRRILRTTVRFGLLDRPQQDLAQPLFDLANDQVALDSARESLVLLKNANHVLPLDAGAIRTIAVIGPDAYPGYATAGGSSHIDTFRTESILGGIVDYLGQHVRVLYDRGLPSPDTVFKRDGFAATDGQPGLRRETFDNPDFRGTPTATGVDAHVDQWKPELWTTPAAQRRSIRWSGRYVAPHAGRYLFLTAAASADSYTLYIDGKAVIAQPKREGQAPLYAALDLKAGQAVQVRLDYLPDVDYSRMGLGVVPVDELISPAALKMAAMADAAVVAVGFDPTSESEAYDRTFALPWGQEALIQAVAKANPKTVVTVTSGGGYATADWLGRVPALLQNWYPGQEGGRAVAEVLFGARSPEGKLPISFERQPQDNPTHDYYYAPPHAPGAHPTVRYGEGLFVGYRWYTSHPDKPQPLFPFGYGLSYTTFAFSGLEVKPAAARDGELVQVSFVVRNTGKRAGAEVAQVYVSDPSASVERPERVRLLRPRTQRLEDRPRPLRDPRGRCLRPHTVDRRPHDGENTMSRVHLSLACLLAFGLCAGGARAASAVPASHVQRLADGAAISFDGSPQRLRLQVVSDRIIHVTAVPKGGFDLPPSLIALKTGGDGHFNVGEHDGTVTLDTPAIEARVSLRDGAVSFYGHDGKPILAEQPHGRSFTPVMVDGKSFYAIRQQFASPSDEAFYGLGQHQEGVLDYKGKDVELAQHNMDIGIPFVVSSRNYGVLWDNNSITRFGDPRPYQPIDHGLKLFDADGKPGGFTANYYLDGKLKLSRDESEVNYQYIKDLKHWPAELTDAKGITGGPGQTV